MTVLQDFRLALRALLRRPGFTTIALLMLALAIGANTAIFSVVDAVLLSPLPFEDSDELVFLTPAGNVSLPDGVDWRTEGRTFAEIALFLRTWAFDLAGDSEPQRIQGAVVEPQFFDVLKVEPLHGRVFTAVDNQLGGTAVAVISHGLWLRQYGGDLGVIGQTIRLSDQPTTVLGIMPQALDFLNDGVELWVPAAVATPWAVGDRGTNNFDAIGRLRPGVELAAAQSEMLALSTRLAAEYPRTNAGKIIRPLPLLEFMVRGIRPALLALLGAVGLVLLIACLNLVSLMLARSIRRRRDFATRRSLGGSRQRIVQQMTLEGVTLALLGGALGVLVAVWGRDLLLAIAPASLPRSADVSIDLQVLGFAFGLSVLSGLMVGLVPAAHILTSAPAASLRGGGKTASEGRGGQRLLAGLVASEVALACLLLVGCGLLIRSLHQLGQVELGFAPENVLVARLVLPESRYSEREAQSLAFQSVVDAIAALPGVDAAASVIGAPLSPLWGNIGHRLVVEGQPATAPGEAPAARSRPVTGDFFRALGQPILEGRPFTSADHGNALPVAIVNQTFAREHWGDASPIGRRIAWRLGDEPRWMTIVGITTDVKSSTVDAEDVAAIYTPYLQRQADWQRFGTLIVRTASDPIAFVRSIQQAAWTIDPTVPLTAIETLEHRLARSLAPERFNASVFGFFAAVALTLAMLGIYGVLAFAVERRRREIGIRMALGAGRHALLRSVVGRGMAMAAIGLGCGLAAAIALSRVISGLLFEVHPTDGSVFAAVVLCVVAGAFLGCYLPADRASRVDPVVALRHD